MCAFVFAPGASAATGGCQLKGTAAFTPGLSTTSQPFTYSFGGDLTNCQSTEAGAPATGTVQAGGTYTDAATGNAYRLPASTGTGGCASSAAMSLDGTVVDSVTLQPVDPLDPPLTLTTTRYQGSASHGLLAFEATATDCQTGVSTAGIEGVVGLNG